MFSFSQAFGRTLMLSLFAVIFACGGYTPKPRAYMRMDLPAHAYCRFDPAGLPYTFDLSTLADAQRVTNGLNIAYPALRAMCYCSYIEEGDATDWRVALAESRTLVMRHAKRPEDIREKAYTDSTGQVYASLFLLEGDAASPIQFTLTDSLARVFRGALFYDVTPNADSLAPVTAYLCDDIIRLIQSFRWKN